MNMCLPNDVSLYANYEPLKRVTHHFKRDATRSNCAKVDYKCVLSRNFYDIPQHFEDYFLNVKIL